VLDEPERDEPMLPILTAVSAGSVVLLTYFGISFWREARRLQHRQEQVFRLRRAIAQKRKRNRHPQLYRLDPVELLPRGRMKKL
jgi:hypothetical protein